MQSPRARRRERRATARATARAATAPDTAGAATPRPPDTAGAATPRPPDTAGAATPRPPDTAGAATPRPPDTAGAATPRPPDTAEAAARLAAHPRRDAALAVLGLAGLVVTVYLPALSGGFVWDDVAFSEEPVIHRWSGLWSIWLSPADVRNEGHYWPLVYTTFWLEHKLWGLAPLGYHLVNVALHLANTVLLWRLLLALAAPGAFAVAAVFAVHPLHVESVAWIIERKDLLSALCYLGAVLAWVRFTRAPRPGPYWLALGLFTAGLLSKSIVVTLPAALLIWHWWERGRVTGRDALRLAPFFVVGLGVTAADLAYYTSRESLALGYSAVERVLIAARALWFYAGKLVWPADLAGIYPLWEIRSGDLLGWAYVAAAAGLTGLLWLFRGRLGRGPLAGAAFFALTLSPVLGFVDYGYMQFSLVADRFQYLAGIGVIAVLVGGAARGAGRLPGHLRPAATSALVFVLVALGILTWRQCGIYRDESTFFSHVVAHNPEARDAHLNLGGALLDAGRPEESHAASLIAVRQRPEAVGAHINLARALVVMERFEEAEPHLARAMALDPRNHAVWMNMADLRRRQGRYEAAAEWFGKVLAEDARHARAHFGLGIALHELARHEEALAALDRALALAPDASGSSGLRSLHTWIGRASQALGRLDEAERHLLRAARLDPHDAAPLVDLASLRAAQGRHEEAGTYLRRARELAPGDATVLHTVAESLRKRGRYAGAVESYRAALAIDPDFAMAHAGLGDALYRLERYEEAIESLDRSVALHPHPPTATARLVLMGSASEKLGRTAAAVAHYERAVAIDPRNVEALDHLAMARFGEERYEEALGLYRTLLEAKPGSARTHANLGATLYHLGRPEEALRSFERALSLDPDLESARAVVDQLGRTLRERGE